MSRGFVKEPDEIPDLIAQDEGRERAITRSGLVAFTARFTASADPDERKRLASLLSHAVVRAIPSDVCTVAFGANVVVTEAGRGERRFSLVGEDEIDVEAGRIGIDSPLARALLGARAGMSVTWLRPSGNVRLTIRSVDYVG